ncbi:Uncharacterised protein [Bordetella pertussis]|nr:Uncharacterised protein [Bordetella pertussis]
MACASAVLLGWAVGLPRDIILRAIQVNADAGAYAGLALGLQVILASLLIPVAFRLAAGLGGS